MDIDNPFSVLDRGGTELSSLDSALRNGYSSMYTLMMHVGVIGFIFSLMIAFITFNKFSKGNSNGEMKEKIYIIFVCMAIFFSIITCLSFAQQFGKKI